MEKFLYDRGRLIIETKEGIHMVTGTFKEDNGIIEFKETVVGKFVINDEPLRSFKFKKEKAKTIKQVRYAYTFYFDEWPN